MRAKKFGLVVLVTFLLSFSCVTAVAKTKIRAKSVSLNVTSATIAVGDIVTLNAVLKPANSTDTLKWTSADKSVATVNKYGVVTAISEGKTTIKVKTSSKKTASMVICVKNELTLDEIKSLISSNMLTEEKIKTIIQNDILSESQITQMIKENSISEERIKSIVNECLSENNNTSHNGNNMLTEESIKTIIQNNTISQNQVTQMIKENSISEERVKSIVKECLSENNNSGNNGGNTTTTDIEYNRIIAEDDILKIILYRNKKGKLFLRYESKTDEGVCVFFENKYVEINDELYDVYDTSYVYKGLPEIVELKIKPFGETETVNYSFTNENIKLYTTYWYSKPEDIGQTHVVLNSEFTLE